MFLSVKPLANIVSNYACRDRNYKRQYTVHNNHPLSKKAGFGQRKDYSTKLTFRTVFQKMCLCFFGVEDSLDMADLFFVLWKGIYIFALRPGVLYFLHAAAWRRKYSNPYAEFEGDGFLCFREKREIERKVKKLLRYFCGCGTMSLDDSIQSIIRKTPKVLASGFFYS